MTTLQSIKQTISQLLVHHLYRREREKLADKEMKKKYLF